MRKLGAALSAFFLGAASAWPADVTTVADVRVFGGQHFFQGAASDVASNVNAIVTPVVKFSDQWSLLPTYTGEYRGTRDVQELAGGGTLFQDSMRHSLTFKEVYTASPSWKFKGTAGAAMEWLRETKDEKWSDGLFNNRKFSGGVEAEYDATEALGGRLSYDFYALTFPNYQSLESSQDATLSRELAGKDVLNSDNHLFTWSGWSPFPGRMKAEWSVYYNLRSFNDQPVLDEAGQPTGTGRTDNTLSLAGTLTSHPWVLGEDFKVLGDVGLSYTMNTSNQNHYDANAGRFFGKYYDYTEWAARPQLTAGLGTTPWIVTGSAGYAVRQYTDRPVQDASGAYLTAKTHVTEVDASLGLSYPWSKNFKVVASSNLSWSNSNMKYEKTFRYNYRIANYLVGFSYDY